MIADALEGGAAKAYQFTVPEGTLSVETRLENRVGNPNMKLVRGEGLPSIYYRPYYGHDTYGNYGGEYPSAYGFNLITTPNPTSGVYSLIVNASDTNENNDSSYDSDVYMNASYIVRVRQQPIQDLNFAVSQNTNGLPNAASGLLADGQSGFFRVVVPASVDGGPVVGWRLSVSETQGVASVRARLGALPDGSSGTMPFKTGAILVTPPYLTTGVWYVEVKGVGNTAYTLTSLNFAPERPVWTMPLAGQPVTTPGLVGTSYFGDTGIDIGGSPLPGDQGVDLEDGKYHYYAVSVPSNNAVLIRTMLEAISGNPDLYIRTNAPPTMDHNASGQSGELVDRRLEGTGTEYGNWVPWNGKTESFLAGGTWHFAVRAAGGANCRYRLRLSSGNVQAMPLDGGSFSGQILAAKDWRYYKVGVPEDAPASWNVSFSQEQGDVVLHVRDVSPPGNYNVPGSYRDWSSDYKNSGTYATYDPAGTHALAVPPLRPGSTYYLGFRANSDATFSLSTATSGGPFAEPVVVPFYGGSNDVVIGANSSVVFRIDVPANAARWSLSNWHANAVSVYMEQGTLPYLNYSADWYSAGSGNSTFTRDLLNSSWPWLPGYSYYLVATNTSAAPQTIGVASAGAPNASDLVLTMTGGPNPASLGGNVSYTLTVSNKVSLAALNVALTNWLPDAMAFVSATSTVGTCSGSNPVVCSIGTLNSGGRATVTIVARPTEVGLFTNSAAVSCAAPELNYSDNAASVATRVEYPLGIATVSLPTGQVAVGYSATLVATGGVPPYVWSAATGTRYAETAENNSFTAIGTAMGWRADDTSWRLPLPFAFSFFGQSYTQCWVDSNGKIRFDQSGSSTSSSTNTLMAAPMVSALGGDLRTDGAGDIYVATNNQQCVIRWAGTYYSGGLPIHFSVALSADGRIRMSYGSGNASGGMIGISAGNGTNYLVSARNLAGGQNNAPDIVFTPGGGLPAGLTFSESGVLEGIPSAKGTNAATLFVRDSDQLWTSRTFTLVILPADNSIPTNWLGEFDLPLDGSANDEDPDGDGFTNWEEWRAWTNPTNRDSFFQFRQSPGAASSGVVVRFPSVTGRTYSIHRSTNLIAVPPFRVLQMNIPGQSDFTEYLDIEPAGPGGAYYRVGVE